MIFNERLKELRTEKGLTQVQAAEAISIAYRNYQRLEADGNLPNFSNFVAIADLFEVSLDYLAGRTDVREVNGGALPAPEHQIMLEAEVDVPEGTEDLLRRVISAALAAEGVDLPCEINVLLTDDEGIHQVNREMRQVDRPTDVLSFPMFDLKPGEKPEAGDEDPESGLVPLGDMCISLERAAAQAGEFGHSVERELSYLTVHSVLHLLGYDHMDEGPMKRQMRVTPLSASGPSGGGRRTGGDGAGDQPQGSGRDGRLGVRRAGRLLVAVEEAGKVSGEFRRPGGEFLSGCPERNQRSTRARLRMSASRSYSPPLDPILREPN